MNSILPSQAKRARASSDAPAVSLALQGGGSHGAFAWGVLDRLLEAVAEGRFRIAAISGASAGGINAALVACGLASGDPQAARDKLRTFWTGFSAAGTRLGNPFFGYAEPGLFGLNIDWSPIAIAIEAAGLVVSPYTNPFYSDALTPILRQTFSASDFELLNGDEGPQVFVSAVDIRTNARTIFTRPDLSIDALRASACLPQEFRTVAIDKGLYWDGGFLGNPALSPLVDLADDLLLVVLNPFKRNDMPPISARAILDRLNEVTFNASLVLELNAIEAVNRVLDAVGPDHATRYRPIRVHRIENDRFMETLGFVSKNSTSPVLIDKLFTEGRATAHRWLAKDADSLGHASSFDAHAELLAPVLNAKPPST